MDITDVNKVANRKRINIEAEKLRDKVSRETAKIIKLKVAQDTAYWDLKEKLHQLENNHERLQQNMVEVQMQHETLSGQYQDELRLRPETLNKLSSTREICNVLEDYSERLKETLSRCKSDQVSLCDVFNKFGSSFKEIKAKHTQEENNARQLIESLQDKLHVQGEHYKQFQEYFSSAKQHADGELCELKSKLDTACAQKDELLSKLNDHIRKLDLCNTEVNKKEEQISNLQSDMKQLIQQFNAQSAEMKANLVQQDNKIKELKETNHSLQKALENQEEFTNTINGQNNLLQEKISAMEETHQAMQNTINELQISLKESQDTCATFKQEIDHLWINKTELEKAVECKDQVITEYEKQTHELKQNISELQLENGKLNEVLDNSIEESNKKSARIDELMEVGQQMEKKLKEITKELEHILETHEFKQKELNNKLAEKDKDIESKVKMVNQLMLDVKNGTDTRVRLETTMVKMNQDMTSERETWKEKEKKFMKQIEQHEVTIRDKDIEFNKQISIIKETRNEKERLMIEIQQLQNTISNVQKELTGRSQTRESLVQPEQDDNAVMFPPPPTSHKEPSLFSKPEKLDVEIGKIQAGPKQLDYIFKFFSDSEGDTMDPPPKPAPSKRRGGVPISHEPKRNTGLDPLGRDVTISLSQVRNEMNTKKTFFKSKQVDKKPKK